MNQESVSSDGYQCDRFTWIRKDLRLYIVADYAFKFFDNPPVLYDYLRVGEEAGDIEESGDLESGVIGVYCTQHVEIYE